MQIAVTSQNFRTITGHAGKARRFLVFACDDLGQLVEVERLDLPKTMSLHAYHGDDHPLYACDVLITAGCGENFRRRVAAHGVEVVATAATDPLDTVGRWLRGESLPPAAPHEHDHASEAGDGHAVESGPVVVLNPTSRA